MLRASMVFLALMVSLSDASLAQPTVLTSYAFSSVGGTSSAGGLALGFTAGQPVTGTLSSTRYQESVGFWRWMLWRDATGVEDGADQQAAPGVFRLDQNYPNPFNPQTTIRFAIPASAGPSVAVSLRLYDVSGRLVRALSTERRRPGIHTVIWDGRNDAGVQVRSGVYFCKMRAGTFEATRRLVLVK